MRKSFELNIQQLARLGYVVTEEKKQRWLIKFYETGKRLDKIKLKKQRRKFEKMLLMRKARSDLAKYRASKAPMDPNMKTRSQLKKNILSVESRAALEAYINDSHHKPKA